MSATTYGVGPAGDDEGVDIEALLAPIPGDNPAGEDLLYAGLHDEIREARREDAQLPTGDWQRREIKLADWPRVAALASEALLTRTKDLQIGTWLAEALLKLHGFTGLRDGLKLIRGLEQNFWDGLYPPLDEEGDADDRARLLAWLDDKLSVAVMHIPLTNGAGGLSYAYIHWQGSQSFDIPPNVATLNAAEQEKYADLREQAEEEKKITSEQWRAAKKLTGRGFYEETVAVLDQCWAEFQALAEATRQLFGTKAPGMAELEKTLEVVRELADKIVIEKRTLEPGPVVAAAATAAEAKPPAGDNQTHAPSAAAPQTAAPSGVATSREGAYRKLAEAAAYFRLAEPHSPVPYLIERAIKWGQMPLEDWLAEVVKSETVLSHVWETLGVGHAQSAEDEDAADNEGS
jgi:type VI secretion system protein ImpA